MSMFDNNPEYIVLDTLFDKLFPICRSITGPGFLESLKILQTEVPFIIESVPSGTKVFDWEIPLEWRINDAYLMGPDGKKYADFKESNLFVVNYSEPVDTVLPLDELKNHLYTNPKVPYAILYVTSYYDRKWGFCIPFNKYNKLPRGNYHAYIDSKFTQGNLYYGQTVLEGSSKKEILLTSYLCHPSLANNELSGPLVLTALYNRIKRWSTRFYTYRFLINPETIGSISYLWKYGAHLKNNLISGAVLTCLGGPNDTLTYKLSRKSDSLLDKVVKNTQLLDDNKIIIRNFTPLNGSDERQFCSPGFNLPVGQFARTMYGEYDEYHNSADNKDFMKIESLIDTINSIESVLKKVEYSGNFINLKPYGEPMLSKYDLYPTVNSPLHWEDSSDNIKHDKRKLLNTVLLLLSYCDGSKSLVGISTEFEIPLTYLISVVKLLEPKKLIKRKE